MHQELLNRLEAAAAKLLERNRQLESECRVLKQGQLDWEQERAQLLAEIDKILGRLENVELEDP